MCRSIPSLYPVPEKVRERFRRSGLGFRVSGLEFKPPNPIPSLYPVLSASRAAIEGFGVGR